MRKFYYTVAAILSFTAFNNTLHAEEEKMHVNDHSMNEEQGKYEPTSQNSDNTGSENQANDEQSQLRPNHRSPKPSMPGRPRT